MYGTKMSLFHFKQRPLYDFLFPLTRTLLSSYNINRQSICFAYRCLSFCPFSFRHCVVCPTLIYGFWLPLWYLQTLHIHNVNKTKRKTCFFQSLVFCVLLWWALFVFFCFTIVLPLFYHCIARSSANYGLLMLLWYHQSFLTTQILFL